MFFNRKTSAMFFNRKVHTTFVYFYESSLPPTDYAYF